jgi:hypothetical protein
LPANPKQAAEYLARRLSAAYDSFLKTAPTNSYAVVDEQGWHLSADSGEKLDQEAQDGVAAAALRKYTVRTLGKGSLGEHKELWGGGKSHQR